MEDTKQTWTQETLKEHAVSSAKLIFEQEGLLEEKTGNDLFYKFLNLNAFIARVKDLEERYLYVRDEESWKKKKDIDGFKTNKDKIRRRLGKDNRPALDLLYLTTLLVEDKNDAEKKARWLYEQCQPHYYFDEVKSYADKLRGWIDKRSNHLYNELSKTICCTSCIDCLVRPACNNELDGQKASICDYYKSSDRKPDIEKVSQLLQGVSVQDIASGLLSHSCKRGYTDVVKIWLDHNPGLRIEENNNGPLENACSGGYLDIVKLLIEKRPEKDDLAYCYYSVSIDPVEGTPLRNALKGGHLEVAQYLVDKGAKIERVQINNDIRHGEGIKAEVIKWIRDKKKGSKGIKAAEKIKSIEWNKQYCQKEYNEIKDKSYLREEFTPYYLNNQKIELTGCRPDETSWVGYIGLHYTNGNFPRIYKLDIRSDRNKYMFHRDILPQESVLRVVE